MALRKGIVVDVHPDDHAVDLVLVDNYSRLVGVQVSTHTGSSRSGSIELPDVEVRKDKWNIGTPTGQEVQALVDYVGSVPVVTGFIYPQISQMTHKDGKLRYARHTSDVQTYTDGDGNMGILHPCGAHILIGEPEQPRKFDGNNVDKNLAIDRNTDKDVLIKVELKGKAVMLLMKPDGSVLLECKTATIKASDSIVLDTPQTHVTGKLQVDEEVTTNSTITSSGDQIAGGIKQMSHKHGGVQSGGSDTGGPK